MSKVQMIREFLLSGSRERAFYLAGFGDGVMLAVLVWLLVNVIVWAV